jgi:hypothetical protein
MSVSINETLSYSNQVHNLLSKSTDPHPKKPTNEVSALTSQVIEQYSVKKVPSDNHVWYPSVELVICRRVPRVRAGYIRGGRRVGRVRVLILCEPGGKFLKIFKIYETL